MITLVQCLLRLMGVYHILRAIDSGIGFLIVITANFSTNQDLAKVASMAIGSTLIMVILELIAAVTLFIIAPKLARLIVGRDKEIPSSPSLDLALIASSAMLIAAWALVRLVDYIYQILVYIKHDEEPFQFSDIDTYHIIINIALLLSALLLVKKSPVILKKLKAMDSPKNAASPENPSSL